MLVTTNIRPIYSTLLFSLIIGLGVILSGTSNLMFLLAFFLFLVNVFCSFEQRSSKILAFLLLVVAFTLMTATNNNNGLNGDYRAYHALYEHFRNGGSMSNIYGYKAEYGYMVLMLALSKLNLTYNFFVSVLAVVSITLIHSTVSKITRNYNLVLVCYMLSPFFYDVFQFRYFFAYSIVVFALQYILFEEKKNYLKYAMLVIFASLFHITIVFFLLYLVNGLNIKIFIKASLFMSVLVTAFSFVTKINVVDIVASFVSFSKFENYTSGTIGYQLNALTSLSIILMIVYFILVIKSIFKKEQSYTNRQIMLLNLLGLLILPFLLVSLDFERFLRPVLLINYALIAEKHNLFGAKSKVVIISLIIVLSARQFLMSGVTDTILDNNYILDYFENLLT